MDAGAGRDAIHKDHPDAVLALVRGQDHALAFHAAERSRLEVCHQNDMTADEVLGLVPFCNPGGHGPLTLAVIERQLQQLFRALNRFAGGDLGDAQLHLGKVADADLCQPLNLLRGFAS